MVNKKYFVYLGCSGFPFGLAAIQKMILISKSILYAGDSVTIICEWGIHDKESYPELKASGSYENIEYIYASGSSFRSTTFISRNLLKIIGIVNELVLIYRLKHINKLDYAIISTGNIYSILFYSILAKLFSFKTILSYAEYYPGIKKKWYQRSLSLRSNLYDKYAPILVDGVFPISEYLINHLKEKSINIKYLKIPVLVDTDRYKNINESTEQKYFLFCGAADYIEIIQFIIDSFVILNRTTVYLYLVINGRDDQLLEIKNIISACVLKNNIRLFSNLSEKLLNVYYLNAEALLIPLRPTIQDCARFPHKIGEYLATGNPVISTNYGEVKFYFTDMLDMLIADSYDTDIFAGKMQFVLDNPLIVKEIGINGRNVALQKFDFRIQANLIHEFVNSKL